MSPCPVRPPVRRVEPGTEHVSSDGGGRRCEPTALVKRGLLTFECRASDSRPHCQTGRRVLTLWGDARIPPLHESNGGRVTMKRRLMAPSPALVISLIALFVALGGTTAYASGLISGR